MPEECRTDSRLEITHKCLRGTPQCVIKHQHLSPLHELLSLAGKLPEGLSADWDGTNHFELTCHGDDYWWMTIGELADYHEVTCDSVIGQRLGLLMDIAEALKMAEPQIQAIIQSTTEKA